MGRPNWYADHPAACTCAACEAKRLGRYRRRGIPVVSAIARWLRKLFKR